MTSSHFITRRKLLHTTASAGLAWSLLGITRLAATDTPLGAKSLRPSPLKLGLASYSLRHQSLDMVIEAAQQLELNSISLHRVHAPWDGSTDECRTASGKLRAAKVALTGTGVMALSNDEAKVRTIFDNARAAGLPTLACKPDANAFPLLDRLVREYDIRLAIHNHGPEDELYPTPFEAWKAAQPYDSRIGLCIDVGHAFRGGADPADAIRKCRDRVYDIHMKDVILIPGSQRDMAVEVGRGQMDIRKILEALIGIRYAHVVSFEYEKRTGNPNIGLAESVGYVRGLLSTLS